MSNQLDIEEHSIADLYKNLKQEQKNDELSDMDKKISAASNIICMIGIYSVAEAQRGNRNGALMAYKCFSTLTKAGKSVPKTLKNFVTENLDSLASGMPVDKALQIEKARHRPAKFDGFNYCLEVIEAWAKTDLPVSVSELEKFERSYRKSQKMNLYGFDDTAIQKSFKRFLNDVNSFLDLYRLEPK